MAHTPVQAPQSSRERILLAAIREFSDHGLAGARTGAIATAAGVNKALLYYYFRDKESLYVEALEEVARKVAGDALAILDLNCSAGERILRFVLQHFDRILSKRDFQALMQQEMVRFHQGQSTAMGVIAKKAFEPMFGRALALVEEGIADGEFCHVDPMQVLYAALGANVFYFLSVPMMKLLSRLDPLDPQAIAARRTRAVEFLGQSLFMDRKHGMRLAKQVLASTPIPAHAVPERKTA
jgi:TetR/AcrR family transcriptional regulator